MTRVLRRLALCAAVLLAAATAAAAEALPARVVLVRPAHPDALEDEIATRLQGELLAAGFVVVLVDEAPGVDPRAQLSLDAPSRAVAAVAIVRTQQGVAADVWVEDRASRQTTVRRVDVGAAAASSRPAALAIRAVELLRATLVEATRPRPAAPESVAKAAAIPDASVPPPVSFAEPAPRRALLAGPTLELGLAAVYGLGDSGSRLAPAFRFAYGAASGLAGRLTLIGPTATDQLGLIELVYGFDRSFRLLAPVVSLGAGAGHAHLTDSGGSLQRQLRTEAWVGVLAAGAGVAARATDRAAILFDVHALLADPGPGAIIGGDPSAGKAELVMTASLGVLAGF